MKLTPWGGNGSFRRGGRKKQPWDAVELASLMVFASRSDALLGEEGEWWGLDHGTAPCLAFHATKAIKPGDSSNFPLICHNLT